MTYEEIEKEAEEYADWFWGASPSEQRTIKQAYQKGAEFGYNKANEWHFVKDGDIPKDEDYKLCITDNGNYYIARYEELFITWSNQEHKEVCCPYAWKEIVPPKESEMTDDLPKFEE